MCTFHLAYFESGCLFMRVRPHQGRTVLYRLFSWSQIQIHLVLFIIKIIYGILSLRRYKHRQLKNKALFSSFCVFLVDSISIARGHGSKSFFVLLSLTFVKGIKMKSFKSFLANLFGLYQVLKVKLELQNYFQYLATLRMMVANSLKAIEDTTQQYQYSYLVHFQYMNFTEFSYLRYIAQFIWW